LVKIREERRERETESNGKCRIGQVMEERLLPCFRVLNADRMTLSLVVFSFS